MSIVDIIAKATRVSSLEDGVKVFTNRGGIKSPLMC
jgi:hypothetical protein